MAVDRGLATHSRKQTLHSSTVHCTNSNSILNDDIVGHTNIYVGVHTHFLHIAAGGYLLLGLKLVFVAPVLIVGSSEVVRQTTEVVAGRRGSGNGTASDTSPDTCVVIGT